MNGHDFSEEDLDMVLERAGDLLGRTSREKFGGAIDEYGLKAVMAALDVAEAKSMDGGKPSQEYVFAILENRARERKPAKERRRGR